MMRFMFLALAMVSTSSCTIQSSQFETIARLLSPKVDTMVDYRWQLDVLGVSYPLYAVALESGILFTNSSGIVVKFDGWVLREFVGIAVEGAEIGLQDYGSARVVKSRYDSKELQCDVWRQAVDGTGLLRGYTQHCSSALGEAYVSAITLSETGAIASIEQIATPDGDMARLSLMSKR